MEFNLPRYTFLLSIIKKHAKRDKIYVAVEYIEKRLADCYRLQQDITTANSSFFSRLFQNQKIKTLIREVYTRLADITRLLSFATDRLNKVSIHNLLELAIGVKGGVL